MANGMGGKERRGRPRKDGRVLWLRLPPPMLRAVDADLARRRAAAAPGAPALSRSDVLRLLLGEALATKVAFPDGRVF